MAGSGLTTTRPPALAERIVAMFAVIDGRAWGQLPAYFDPDIVYERPGYPAFRGLERLMTFYTKERIIETGDHQLAIVLADADCCACHGRFVGRARDGSPLDESFADFYRFREGLIVHRRSFFFRPAL